MSEPWGVPREWVWTTMGEATQVVGGGTPRTGTPEFWEGGTIPWLTPADLSGYSSKTIARGDRDITRAGLESSAARMMPAGTVLFSSRAPIGYVAIAENPVSTNQGFKSFVPPVEVSSDYLYYYLQRARPLALALSSGTTFQEVSTKRAASLPLALAPFGEQGRIVAKIEELFSELGAGVAALERAQPKLERHRASVLKAAVEGRLTEEWRKEHPPEETGQELLERILVERRRRWEEKQLAKYEAKGKKPPKGWREKYEEPIGPDAAELPHLPHGWCWAAAEQLAGPGRPIRYGIIKPGPDTPSGVPYVRVNEMKTGVIDVPSLRRCAAERAARFAGATLKRGDLLVSKDGTIGKVAIVPPDLDGGNITQHVLRFSPAPRVCVRYLALAVSSPTVQSRIRGETRGVALQGINVGDFRVLPIPLPPQDEQEAIADVIDLFNTQAAAIQRASLEGQSSASALRQSILKHAFEGCLVPQDPSDEPASALLERIRAEREAERNAKKKQTRRKESHHPTPRA